MVQFQKAVIVIIIRDIPTMLHFRFFFIIVLLQQEMAGEQ